MNATGVDLESCRELLRAAREERDAALATLADVSRGCIASAEKARDLNKQWALDAEERLAALITDVTKALEASGASVPDGGFQAWPGAAGRAIYTLAAQRDLAQEERDSARAEFERLKALRCDCDEESGAHAPTCVVMLREQFTAATAEVERLRALVRRLGMALASVLDIIDAAGLNDLARGVQLGATAWYVKASDRTKDGQAALDEAQAFLEGREDAHLHRKEGR